MHESNQSDPLPICRFKGATRGDQFPVFTEDDDADTDTYDDSDADAAAYGGDEL